MSVGEISNEDVLARIRAPGDSIRVSDLSARNQAELRKLDFSGEAFVWEPESLIGNHLMKTVVMSTFLEANRVRAVYIGVRWDEQVERSNETFLSLRADPVHTRVHPILHFRERDIWEATHRFHVPFNALYAQGYRSLGTKYNTTKNSNIPAWEQDLENTCERGGRRQDRDGDMGKLRKLGYM